MAVMICLLLVTAITGSLLRMEIESQRALRNVHRRAQAEWLAEAALDREAALSETTPESGTNRWELPTELLGEPAAVDVTSVVLPATAAQPAMTETRAVAVLSNETTRRIQVTRVRRTIRQSEDRSQVPEEAADDR